MNTNIGGFVLQSLGGGRWTTGGGLVADFWAAEESQRNSDCVADSS